MLRLIKKYKPVIIVALVILGVILVYKANKEGFDQFIKTIILPGSFVGWIKYFLTVALMDFVFINPFSPDILVSWFVEQLVTQLTPRMMMDLLLTASIGALGSTAGALAGYGMGRLIISGKRMKFLQWFLHRVGGDDLGKARKRINKFGIIAIGVAALPFVPFGLFCWAAGMVRVRLIPFILICLIVRFFRFLIIGPLWAWGIL